MMATNVNATYSVQSASVNSLSILAVSVENPSNTVFVTIDSNGKLENWTFAGDFQ
jgi:hypothetical protein